MISQTSQKIYDYIRMRISSDISPTLREMCADLDIKSISTASKYVDELCDLGLIDKLGHHGRSIRLATDNAMQIPIMGTVTAGAPITAIEDIEGYVPYKSSAYPYDALFALKIRGESMIEAGIFDGDVVVVHKTPTAQNGEIVVALIEDEATVKTFYKENNHFRLQPENPEFEPIIVSNLTILGKVVSLIRYY